VNSFAVLHFLVLLDRRVGEAHGRLLNTVREHVRGPVGLHSYNRCCPSWQRQTRPRAVGKAAVLACNVLHFAPKFWMVVIYSLAVTRPTMWTGSPEKTALRWS
jgi:hypothetical protein